MSSVWIASASLISRFDNSRAVCAVARNFLEATFHAFDRPKQIHGGRPGGGQSVGNLAEFFAKAVDVFCFGIPNAESDAHRRRDADRRRSANNHDANGFGNFLIRFEDRIFLDRRQLPLVDHHHAVIGPFDRLNANRVKPPNQLF